MNVVPRARFEEVLDQRDGARAERDAALAEVERLHSFAENGDGAAMIMAYDQVAAERDAAVTKLADADARLAEIRDAAVTAKAREPGWLWAGDVLALADGPTPPEPTP